MGQFLAFGLVTQIIVDKNKLATTQLTPDQLQERMVMELHYNPELYLLHEHNNCYSFDLREDIFHAQLLPLLEQFYPLYYNSTDRYQDVLERLHELPPSEWLDWANGKPYEAFQIDCYGMVESIEEKFTDIILKYKSILLAMDGKIIMEVYGQLFRFINYTIKKTFPQFSLAGAFRIYISG